MLRFSVLANVLNEAAILATRKRKENISMKEINTSIDRTVIGLEGKQVARVKARQITAFHEMGHALVGMALPGSEKVHKVSIIPRGIGALGYTISRPTEDRFLMSREELKNKIAVLFLC